MDTMNTEHNQAAATKLTMLIADEAKAGDVGLHVLPQLASWQGSIAVKEYMYPKIWRLVEKEETGIVTDEELVFSVYGSIQGHNLLPFNKSDLYMSDIKKIKYLKQTITINGLGGDEMKEAWNAMRMIHGVFDRTFKQGQLEDLYKEDDYTTINAANRLMTPSKDTDQPHVPYESHSDPDGMLESIARQGFRRTEDNIVNFVKVESKHDGSKSYVKTTPQTFRNGDLVAIQVSFCVVPLKRGKYRMLTLLRSITLIESAFAQYTKLPVNMGKFNSSLVKRRVRTGEESHDSDEINGLPRKIWRGMTAMDIVGKE
ncbi:hypothetical protein H0H93_002625 [Arthromyces matolae]|nr:hypothetical protein H0H93_002625 [Arthromyces matolae]